MPFSRLPVFTLGVIFLLPAPSAAAAQEAPPPRTGVPGLRERIAAHTAIERIYYRNRSWPKENRTAKPPFEEMVPAGLLEMKAAEPLRMSTALKRRWNVEITPAMLQSELERMERESRNRFTLHEIFAALHGDPALIAETLARDNLAQQLIRNQYAGDAGLHRAARNRAEAAALRAGEADWKNLDGDYQRIVYVPAAGVDGVDGADGADGANGTKSRNATGEVPVEAGEFTALRGAYSAEAGDAAAFFPHGRRRGPAFPDSRAAALSRIIETPEQFRLERALTVTDARIEVELLTFPKRPFDVWWAENSPAFGDGLPSAAAPSAATTPAYHLPAPNGITAAGSEWDNTRMNTPGPGGAPAPAARKFHSAVWTGTEMIIWGGTSGGYVNSGGRYNPATDYWLATSVGANVPAARTVHTAVWTGSVMIVWGGGTGAASNTGGRYNPWGDTWLATSVGANLPVARVNHSAVWTGGVMIVWGGNNPAYLNSGGRYDPNADTWLATSTGAGVPSVRDSHVAVWTGTGGVMIVWGGYTGAISLNTGGRYNPATDTWQTTSTGANVPAPRDTLTAVWTGSKMIVWGGTGAASFNSGGRYDPVADTWQATSTGANVPAPRYYHTAVWTGSVMIVWGGADADFFNDGGRYDPVADSWLATSLGTDVPAIRYIHTAVWTGQEMVVWGGGSPGNLNTGGRYNPASDSWRPTTITATSGGTLPAARQKHIAIWTGSEMIVWGGEDSSFLNLNTGGRYNPATNAWLATSLGANVPAARYLHTVIWTGSEMVVWGGYGGSYLNTGGRYNPSTDAWLATSLGANVPAARRNHTAVWTGSEMIVWGGQGSVDLNTGGRYNPSTNSWLATSMGANVPTARYGHTGVWTGSEMIVWGGVGGPYLNTGGRYNPSTDAWLATSMGANVPAVRYQQTAIWTGAEMIIWGGFVGTAYLNTGGRYNPATNSWLATSLGANVPALRGYHTAIWTGSEMIVWGGLNGPCCSYNLNTGGRYNPATNSWIITNLDANTPSARYSHTAVWTGTEMIVWGGYDTATSNNGGIYTAAWASTDNDNCLRLSKSGPDLIASFCPLSPGKATQVLVSLTVAGPATTVAVTTDFSFNFKDELAKALSISVSRITVNSVVAGLAVEPTTH